jgi:DNA invertase Pin-like site-specific DNA recombinase
MAKKKRFIALARVSSREQEREGFSLDVQVDALQKYAERHGGEIVRLWRIAETASKMDARTTFKEVVAYAKKNARQLDGFLVYEVDRAARNMHDFLELEKLESEYGLQFISTSQHTPDDPGGRMQRRILASMATFFDEQLALDVREGMARRVQEGWFAASPPYGYHAVRKDGRSVVEVHPDHSKKVERIFHLYAYHQHTLDSLVEKLHAEGLDYTDSRPMFYRSKLYDILRSRAYIGEVPYKDQWLPGKHPPLVDRDTWKRVQTLLGEGVYRDHEMVYASGLITCGHCGCLVTGEQKIKKLKDGGSASTTTTAALITPRPTTLVTG